MKESDYKQYISHIIKAPRKPSQLSIIVVTQSANHEFRQCLNSLRSQTSHNFEIIIVNNGQNKVDDNVIENTSLIQLNKNYGVSLARNIGASFSSANIVAFIDDDAIADQDWVKNIIQSFSNSDILALRGKVIPKNPNNIYNQLSSHYDLGDKIIPSILDTEGNCAIRIASRDKNQLFDPKLFGFEGVDLSYRLTAKAKQNISKIIYNPNVIIYHDYCDNLIHLINKSARHARNEILLAKKYPNLRIYVQKLIYYRQNNTHKKSNFVYLFIIFIETIRVSFSVIFRLRNKLSHHNFF